MEKKICTVHLQFARTYTNHTSWTLLTTTNKEGYTIGRPYGLRSRVDFLFVAEAASLHPRKPFLRPASVEASLRHFYSRFSAHCTEAQYFFQKIMVYFHPN